MNSSITKIVALLLLALCGLKGYSQPMWTIDPFGKEKKPAEYEERTLPSERTDKKFGTLKRFVHNNTTRYNYYFNANNKLNAVIERAKISYKDDYSSLLSFYPYTLDLTAQQKNDLDSVILKSTYGILLHDLRSDWVDNMYLLIGKAYLFRQQYDSAQLTFQFINYNLYPRKKGDDYNKVIGSAAKEDGGISIADKEKRNLPQKILSLPPSRNDALVWLTRTYIEQNELGDAAGMINLLQNDKNVPARLKNDLHEVTAYWFYKQNMFDSSAVHLEKALSAAPTKQDLGRWEYLLGQMYQISGRYDKASQYFTKAAKHTVDPVLEIYANLSDAKMLVHQGDSKELASAIDRLQKMAKRDKYDGFEDIIYYSIAELNMLRPDTAQAIAYYGQSVKSTNPQRPDYKNRALVALGNLAFERQDYENAAFYYDSLNLSDKYIVADSAMLVDRKEVLGRLVEYVREIKREDSLQMVAGMSEVERNNFIRKLIREDRKRNGLKDDDNTGGQTLITRNTTPNDLFASNSRGDWYFYNQGLKSKGYNEFISKWGKRPNMDNWRTKTSMTLPQSSNPSVASQNAPDTLQKPGAKVKNLNSFDEEVMLGNLPTTTETLKESNDIIKANLLKKAAIFKDELQDNPKAIDTYLEYLRRFETDGDNAEAYLGLYLSYQKLGDNAKANYYKNLLATKFAASKENQLVQNPESLNPSNNKEATARYQSIYDKFISGDATGAIADKKVADSLHGKNFWTPQLLYIEAMYYVQQRQDSNAILKLKDIQTLFPNNPLTQKAVVLEDVVKRRAEIEKYLTDLQVTRVEDDPFMKMDDKPAQVVTAAPKPEAPRVAPIVDAPKPVVKLPEAPKVVPTAESGYKWEPDKPHYVVMIFDKVDAMYVREAKVAMDRFISVNYGGQNIKGTRDVLEPGKDDIVFASLTDAAAAFTFMDKAKRFANAEISWLQASKYSFIIITDANYQMLKQDKSLQKYKDLLKTNFGDKF